MTGETLRASWPDRQPHGIILVTGPDRLGQDHHAVRRRCSRLDAGSSNIMTVEDPIEYELPASARPRSTPRSTWTSPRPCARSCGRTRT
jgi:general secretion pathway protein E